ncbi:hypothetical protein FHG87_012866 [Trinorchestia longiramus]|nr:hypothetical protein FHG87_012866 [Trinorchestia longiramus]
MAGSQARKEGSCRGSPDMIQCASCGKKIEKLEAGIVSLRSELEEKRKLKGEKNEKDARSKRQVNGKANDCARHASERNERSRVNEREDEWTLGSSGCKEDG